MTPEEFTNKLYNSEDKDYYGIFPPPIDAQEGLDILIEHFLGKDWYANASMCTAQVNSEAIYEILCKYPEKQCSKKSLFGVLDYLKRKKEGDTTK